MQTDKISQQPENCENRENRKKRKTNLEYNPNNINHIKVYRNISWHRL